MRTDRFFEISVFVQVAHMGSFSSAARVMSLSPSTVSKMMSRLERRLGVALFNRTPRAVRLTAEGQGFLDNAAQLLEDLDRAESQLKLDSPRGVLRVASHPTITTMLLGPILPEFIRQYPEIEVDLSVWGWPISGLSTETVESNVDVALLAGELNESSMIARKIAASRRIVCAAPSYLEKHSVPQVPEDLLDHNCLFGPVFQSHWSLRDNGTIKRIHVKGNVTSNYSELLRQLGLSGVGIVRLADFHVRDDVAAGRLVPILQAYQVPDEEPIYAIYQSHRSLVPRIKTFIDFVRSAIKPLLDAEQFRVGKT